MRQPSSFLLALSTPVQVAFQRRQGFHFPMTSRSPQQRHPLWGFSGSCLHARCDGASKASQKIVAPVLDDLLQEVQGHRAIGEQDLVELTKIEEVAELLLGGGTNLLDGQLKASRKFLTQ